MNTQEMALDGKVAIVTGGEFRDRTGNCPAFCR
jgi:hypothetical protein